jgi:hypothetical protein
VYIQYNCVYCCDTGVVVGAGVDALEAALAREKDPNASSPSTT